MDVECERNGTKNGKIPENDVRRHFEMWLLQIAWIV